jgi:hypothetical protein
VERLEWVPELNLLLSYDGELLYKWVLTKKDQTP